VRPARLSRLAIAILCAGLAACEAPARPAPVAEPAPQVDPEIAATQALLGQMRERLLVMRLVAEAKWSARLAVDDPVREAALLEAMREGSAARGLPAPWVDAFFRAQMAAGKTIQRAQFAAWSASGAGPSAGAADLGGVLRPRIDRINTALLDGLVAVRPALTRPAVQHLLRERGAALLRADAPEISAEVAAIAITPLLGGGR
jgi:chorismate mutase-like protein